MNLRLYRSKLYLKACRRLAPVAVAGAEKALTELAETGSLLNWDVLSPVHGGPIEPGLKIHYNRVLGRKYRLLVYVYVDEDGAKHAAAVALLLFKRDQGKDGYSRTDAIKAVETAILYKRAFETGQLDHIADETTIGDVDTETT